MEDNLAILIVDDIPENIQVAANLLKDEGYDIAFALDGATAIEHLKNHHYDLVLLDIMMPGMDGFEVCRRIKEDEETTDLPVIFLTAKHDIESVKKGFKLGAVDYVSKPFNAEELLVRVNNHLKLVQQQRKLQEMNDNQKRFLSLVSHDIKEPFSTVMGFSKLLKKQIMPCENEKISKYVEMIELSARNGFSLLNNLMEWSRSQFGAIEFNPVQLSLQELFNEVEEQQAFNLQRKGITLEKHFKQDEIRGDHHMLLTVMRNLVANAVKFSEQNSKVVAESEAVEGGHMIYVRDYGIGMSEEMQHKLFKVDERSSTPGTDNEKGAGLGLLISRDFIRQHNGTIEVESKKNEGSVFKIFLPEKPESAE